MLARLLAAAFTASTLVSALTIVSGCTVNANPRGTGDGDGGTSDGGVTATAPLTCAEILDCATKCPDPDEGDVCADACVARGGDKGKALVNDLVSCAKASGCADATCFKSKCDKPIGACLAQSSDTVQGDPSGTPPAADGTFPAGLVGRWAQVGLTNGSSFEFAADGSTTQLFINESNYLCHSKITVAASGVTTVSGSTLAFYRKQGTQTTINCDGPAKATAMSTATLTYAFALGTQDGKDALTLTMDGASSTTFTRQ